MTIQRMRSRLADRSLVDGLRRRVFRRLRGQLFVDRAGADSTRFLAGSPRSGTTWVAEMVTVRQNMRLVFEPFHPGEVPISRAFDHRQYLRPGTADPRYAAPADRIVRGRVRSWWSDRYNRTVLPRRRLVKEVRANLLLGWLHERFPEMPIALVIRHPGAVVASQQSVSWDFNAETERLLAQPQLVEDYLSPYVDLLRQADTPLAQDVLVWCVENYVPLQQFRRGEVHLVCYEHLVTRPEDEYRRLLAFYGLPFHPEMLERADRPSAVTARESALVTGGDVIGSWQAKVGSADRARIGEALERFGLDRLYGTDPMPLLDDPNELLQP